MSTPFLRSYPVSNELRPASFANSIMRAGLSRSINQSLPTGASALRLNMQWCRRRSRSAFTLMELLLVLAILLVIAGLVVPKLAGRQKAANVDATKVSIEGLQQAIQMYSIDHDGRTPTTAEGLGVLTQMAKKDPQWRGPYLDKEPVDAWGERFQYRCPGTHNKDGFDIVSTGPDKAAGTDDDIGNWERK